MSEQQDGEAKEAGYSTKETDVQHKFNPDDYLS